MTIILVARIAPTDDLPRALKQIATAGVTPNPSDGIEIAFRILVTLNGVDVECESLNDAATLIRAYWLRPEEESQ